MTDFALRHCGAWKDGEAPRVKTRIYVVSWDTRHNAYTVESDEMDDFIDWIALNWQRDHTPQDDDEPSEEYLDRLGVRVWEL